MSNKLLKLLLLFFSFLFLPSFSQAVMLAPQVNITINASVPGKDKMLNFNVMKYVGIYDPVTKKYIYDWQNDQQFSLQTVNKTATKSISPLWNNYRITQDPVPGTKLQVTCISDFVPDPFKPNICDGFFPIENGIDIYPAKAWENIICEFKNKIVTPVLIVPGITGTNMEDSSEKLWLNLDKMSKDIGDDFLDSLAFDKDLAPIDSEVLVKDVIGVSKLYGADVFNYTQGLKDELINKGYIENQTLFTFPYDWRYGVSGTYPGGGNNSDMLKSKITQILQQTGAEKVDIIAHSMGGLIVKRYVLANQSDHHIGKAVFVGVPNTGAPAAIKNLLVGDNFKIPFLSQEEVKKISQNMPGVYDLLPSNIYYSRTGSFLQTIDYGKSSISYPLVPSNTIIKDLNYNEYRSFMIAKGLNYQAIDQAEELNNQFFNDYDLRTAGVDLYRITGCKTGTLSKFIVASGRNSTQYGYAGIDFDTGDGTVTIQSSTNLPVDESKKYFSLRTDHSKLMSADGVRQQIASIISGTSTTMNTSAITQDSTKCQLNGKVIEVFSPIDLTITDQHGNTMGLAQDGSIQNNITNADFEVIGEHKFIYLPTDEGQAYNIAMQGTGTGTYTINVKNIQDNQETKVESFYNLPATTALTGSINLGYSSNLSTLTVKQNAASNFIVIYPMPTSKDQCKNNGYKNFGPRFKNQGQCVSFVETGK